MNAVVGLDGKRVDAEPEANQPANAGHNIAARGDIIRSCASDLDAIDEKRKTLSEEAGTVRKRLRDAGISVKEVEVARRWRMQEPEERDLYLDNLREAMRALGVGVQGSLFLDAPAEEAENPDDERDLRPAFLRNKSKDGAVAN